MVAFRRQTVEFQRKATPESKVKYKYDQSVIGSSYQGHAFIVKATSVYALGEIGWRQNAHLRKSLRKNPLPTSQAEATSSSPSKGNLSTATAT